MQTPTPQSEPLPTSNFLSTGHSNPSSQPLTTLLFRFKRCILQVLPSTLRYYPPKQISASYGPVSLCNVFHSLCCITRSHYYFPNKTPETPWITTMLKQPLRQLRQRQAMLQAAPLQQVQHRPLPLRWNLTRWEKNCYQGRYPSVIGVWILSWLSCTPSNNYNLSQILAKWSNSSFQNSSHRTSTVSSWFNNNLQPQFLLYLPPIQLSLTSRTCLVVTNTDYRWCVKTGSDRIPAIS